MLFNNSRKLKQNQKQTQKKWLFEHVLSIQGYGNTAFIYIYFFRISNAEEFFAMGDFKRVYTALLITGILIISYITLVVIPKKAKELLIQNYPEYQIT